MKNDILKLVLINFKKNKINILFILLMFLLSVSMISGLSFYKNIVDMWNDNIKKSYDFNLVNITGDDNLVLLADNIKNNEHVTDVFYGGEFISYAYSDKFKNDNLDGNISLIGTISGTKKIKYGSDLKNDYDLICPSIFFPDSKAYSGKYNRNNIIDLKNFIGDSIILKYIDKYDVTFNLVGIFDSSYDYSLVDTCYISHETMDKLNTKYQNDVVNKNSLFVLLDDINNLNKVFDKYHGLEITKVKTIDTEVGDTILFISSIVILILMILTIFLTYYITERRILNERKNIAIYKICGFSNKIIKKIFYFENFIILFISLIMSILISYIIINKLVYIFLENDPYLSLMNLKVVWYIVILDIVNTFIIIFISTKLSLKKIDNLDIMELIYE